MNLPKATDARVRAGRRRGGSRARTTVLYDFFLGLPVDHGGGGRGGGGLGKHGDRARGEDLYQSRAEADVTSLSG
jgi:hypothetical protein